MGQPPVSLHPSLAAVYSRIDADQASVGKRYPGVMRDLSTNGAFIAGEPLPLLSRVAFSFPLEGYGTVESLGWVLWRRSADCQVPTADGSLVSLPQGFGVLFEAIPLEARNIIAHMVAR